MANLSYELPMKEYELRFGIFFLPEVLYTDGKPRHCLVFRSLLLI